MAKRNNYHYKGETRNCVYCNKSFYSYPYLIKQGYGLFCSHQCHSKSMDSKKYKFCKWCKAKFHIRPSSKNKKFCSRNCYLLHKKRFGSHNKGKPSKMAGENHYNWQGGITPINLKIRRSLRYRQWRDAVFKRDNYTCVWCGDSKGGNLNADHIKPFSDYPELRFDINNGRTLCKKCHKRTITFGNHKKREGVILSTCDSKNYRPLFMLPD